MRGKTRAILALAAAGLFVFSLLSSPLLPARTALLLGNAAVGISAAVPSNPYNKLAQELVEREAELDRREALLRTAENRSWMKSWSAQLAPYSLFASFVLVFVLALNMYRDRRGRRGYTLSA